MAGGLWRMAGGLWLVAELKTWDDRGHFFSIALGSVRECQAIVELEPEAFTNTSRDLLDHLAASTYKLTRARR